MASRGCLFVASVIIAAICTISSPAVGNEHEFTNDFAVEIDGDMTVADLVAQTHSLRVVRQVTYLDNVFHLVHDNTERRSRRSADDITSRLSRDPNVRRVEQQRVLKRDKRPVIHDKQIELPIRHIEDKTIYQRYRDNTGGISAKDIIPGVGDQTLSDLGYNDPNFKYQWYLVNRGQTGGTVGYDINVLPVWKKGYTGKGVVVSILDDGIDHTHPDLQRNFDSEASADLNDRSDAHNDPMPNRSDAANSHGTRCAGEVAAAANNSNCCVGVAYNAKIGGVRMLDGAVTDLLEAEALTYKNQYIDVYSASWGPTDDGKTMEGPHRYCEQALKEGATKGRGGKGSIYVWATGNGGSVQDDCSCDGYVSSIYTLSVGCISDSGLSTYFSEICPSTLAVVFTGGSHSMPGDAEYKAPKIKVVTTDLNGECTLEFQGTSSAAPLAAGCIALVLEANGNLTWRDVQNIVVETARIPNDKEDGWTVNGGGHHVNHRFGFGAMDCGRMVEAAQSWTTVQEQHVCSIQHTGRPVNIYARRPVRSYLQVNSCGRDTSSTINHLEHVQVHVKLEHQRRGDLTIVLVSPDGTRSKVLSPRPLDDSSAGIDFTFMSVHHWGENPDGRWTLEITDVPKDSSDAAAQTNSRRGRLIRWSMTFYGVAGERPNHRVAGASKKPARKTPQSPLAAATDPDDGTDRAHKAGTAEVKQLMQTEEASSESVVIKSTNEIERQRKMLLENGLEPADVDFLMALFAEQEKQRDNEMVASRQNRYQDQDDEYETEKYRDNKNYHHRSNHHMEEGPSTLMEKRNMEGIDGYQNYVEENGDRETFNTIIGELSDILDNN